MRVVFAAVLVGIIGVLPNTSARADWLYAKWGMTPEQVAAASDSAVHVIPSAGRRRIAEINLEYGAEGLFTDASLQLKVSFGFDTKHGGLRLIVYGVVNEAQNEQFKAWMIKTYGPPQQHGGLPVIGMETFGWRDPDDIALTITKDESAFVMQSPVKKN